jgi:putative transposase
MITKSYKVRLYPNNSQEVLLRKTFGCVRKVWNSLLDFNIKGYEKDKENFSLEFNTTHLKKEFEFLNEVSAAALQQKGRDLKETYSQWFKSVKGKRKASIGYPKFKKKGVRESYRLPNQKFTLFKEANLIRLEKIGKVSCRFPANMPDDCKLVSVTISKTSCGKYFASVVTQQDVQPLPQTGKRIGLDIGIKDLMTLSNGVVIKNPRFLRENQSKIKRVQQHLSRKTKGSNRYKKCKTKLAKLHYKVASQREWYLHNITKAIVKDYDIIAIETLSSEGMKGSISAINRSIYDTSIYELTRQLEYKSQWYGKTFTKVDKWFPSSQLCCECGKQNKGIKNLDVREWQCSCGAMHQRDHNAAKNILKQGFKDLSGESLDYKRGDFIDTFNYVKELDNFIETLTIL